MTLTWRNVLFLALSLSAAPARAQDLSSFFGSPNQSAGRQAVKDYASGIADLADEVGDDLESGHEWDAKKLDTKILEKTAGIRSDAFQPVNAAIDDLTDDKGMLGSDAGSTFHELARGYRSVGGSSFDISGSFIPWMLVGILSAVLVYLVGVAVYASQHGDKNALRWYDNAGKWAASQTKQVTSVASVTADAIRAQLAATEADYQAAVKAHDERVAKMKEIQAQLAADPGVHLTTEKAPV